MGQFELFKPKEQRNPTLKHCVFFFWYKQAQMDHGVVNPTIIYPIITIDGLDSSHPLYGGRNLYHPHMLVIGSCLWHWVNHGKSHINI